MSAFVLVSVKNQFHSNVKYKTLLVFQHGGVGRMGVGGGGGGRVTVR